MAEGKNGKMKKWKRKIIYFLLLSLRPEYSGMQNPSNISQRRPEDKKER